jgi:3-oxoacyl-(acyl-carrier-protein) synthase
MAWLTPLGSGLEPVWQKLMSGETGNIQQLTGPRPHYHMPVAFVESDLARNPRLRRSGKITHLAAAAGLAALEDAGVQMTPEIAARTALIFSVVSGGVVYTRKFFEPIARHESDAASPLLFPETVFNAPASHLAAILGVDGATYTLVGDASVGVAALKQAEQLLDTDDIDYCLVVGAEELDWVLCEGYAQWRLTSRNPQMRLHADPPRGALLAEGAAALLVSREGPVRLVIHDGKPFGNRKESVEAITSVLRDLTAEKRPDLIVSSANGTFIDAAEDSAIQAHANGTAVYAPKGALGEALGASALIQTIIGALALRHNQAPATVNSLKNNSLAKKPGSELLKRVLVSVLGFNQQASGLICELQPA